jgi:hypothetical protein
MLDYLENFLVTIGDIFNFFDVSIEQFLHWFLSSYPLTFKCCVALFCVVVAFAPFVLAAIVTFRENK